MLGSAVDLDDNGAHVRVAQRLWKNPDRSRFAGEIRSDSVARTSRARSRGVLDHVAIRLAIGIEKETSSNLKSDIAGTGHARPCETAAL